MFEVFDELASIIMLLGLSACLVYFSGMQIERLILTNLKDATFNKLNHIEWIPRVKFQLILGYSAMISASGFLVAFQIAERHNLSWRYVLLIVSAWFFYQARTRFVWARVSAKIRTNS